MCKLSVCCHILLYTKSADRLFGGAHLDRHEAVALLKELNGLNIIQPSFVTIEKSKQGGFVIVIKGEYDIRALKELVAEKNLAIETNKGKDTITIYEP